MRGRLLSPGGEGGRVVALSRQGRRRLCGGFPSPRSKETRRRSSLAKGEGAIDHEEKNLHRNENRRG
jgi:hypothetical protein